MAVAFDASSENVAAADPQEHTHTPVGTPAAAVVLIVQAAAVGADIVTGVTYGGVAMARVRIDQLTTSEAGATYIYFLGASVPTGPQTISVDRTQGTATVSVVGVTLTADANTEVVDHDGTNSAALANPSITLQYGGRTCIALGALYSGVAAPASAAPNGNMTAIHDHDFGSFCARQDRQTTPGTTDFAFSYTSAEDDVAISVTAISEVVVAQVATPTIDPDGGNFSTSVEVTLACATVGATIYYTDDGTAPDALDNEYTVPFTLTDTKTIKAIGIKAAMTDSEVATATFTEVVAGAGQSTGVRAMQYMYQLRSKRQRGKRSY